MISGGDLLQFLTNQILNQRYRNEEQILKLHLKEHFKRLLFFHQKILE